MVAPALAAFIALVPLQAAAPVLEFRAADGWRALPTFGPGSVARRVPALGRAVAWSDTTPGLRIGTVDLRTADGLLRNGVAVVEVDPGRWRFALSATAGWTRRAAEELLQRDSSLALAANTGLFRETGPPIGLVLVDGTRRAAPAGWLDAVVAIEDGTLRLTDAGALAALTPDASAFQTLPWLVRNERVVLGESSGTRLSRTHRDRRITLCLDGATVRLFLSNFEVFGASVGRVPVGLTIPEQAAVAAALGCRDAVALDGGISAQIAVRTSSRVVRMPGWRKVPLMLVARRR